jgi:DNA polymerase I-like protein with 3'-5' exonuclease and polymerase domains
VLLPSILTPTWFCPHGGQSYADAFHKDQIFNGYSSSNFDVPGGVSKDQRRQAKAINSANQG